MKKNEDIPAILDCNVWIQVLLNNSVILQEKIIRCQYPIIITSYGVVEILRVLKRFSSRYGKQYAELERDFWDICNLDSLQKEFQAPISEKLVEEIKRAPEYRLISDALSIEIKDAPYVVAAYQFKSLLVTKDARTLISKRDELKKRLGLRILTLEEFMQ